MLTPKEIEEFSPKFRKVDFSRELEDVPGVTYFESNNGTVMGWIIKIGDKYWGRTERCENSTNHDDMYATLKKDAIETQKEGYES